MIKPTLINRMIIGKISLVTMKTTQGENTQVPRRICDPGRRVNNIIMGINNSKDILITNNNMNKTFTH